MSAALVTMATLSTLIAVVAQDRALARDLRSAAAERLERSARVAERVVAEYVAGVAERYRAIAKTPQLRATLEVGDGPTLRYLAEELIARHGARAVAFTDRVGERVASAGDIDRLSLAPEHEEEVLRVALPEGALYAAVRVPIESRGELLGSLVVLERIDETRLDAWSELCGATISVAPDGVLPRGSRDRLHAQVQPLGGAALVATSGLEAEHEAVANARSELIGAGGLALVVSILACIVLARSLVRPIQEIQRAVERIRAGELQVALRSRRSDEIGDVARGIDRMAIDLLASRAELDVRIDELNRSRTHLANAQRLARLGSFEIDLQSRELTGSHEFFTLMDVTPEETRKTSLDRLAERVHPDDREDLVATIRDCIRTGLPARFDHRLVGDDSERVMHAQIRVVQDEETGSTRLEGTVQDVTERRRAERQIHYLARHDGLTGLGNRVQMKERLGIAIQRSRRQRTRLAVLFLDLDHFKRVNDTLGHGSGDELLRRVADRVVASVRPRDEVARGSDESAEGPSVARLGGDEFTLMITDLVDPRSLAPIAQRILDALDRPFTVEGRELVVTASIGIATWPQDGEDADTLVRNAESAMYHAKSEGGNAYSYYEDSMNAAAHRRLAVETGLRRGLESEAIEVHYQPRVEIATGRIVGFEALSRWNDPELGAVSPGEFVPIAEQTGLIQPLGRYLLRSVCEQAAAWERSGKAFEGRISVNVSSRQFKSGNVAQDVAEALAASRVNPLRLEIEVTESVMLHDEASVIETLHAIRDQGVTIALDDFGTGYSSLSYLRRLPVDVLKIDMSFVRGITRSPEDAALARAIVAMADALGLGVVAEGVETTAQRDLLRSWGCREMQGFLTSPAVPAADAFALLPG
ncbi:MAG: EAL domain-containing protein [Myxococcales bacterium]|nr:EAL domain-containing protein [Myxococcales bacterium]